MRFLRLNQRGCLRIPEFLSAGHGFLYGVPSALIRSHAFLRACLGMVLLGHGAYFGHAQNGQVVQGSIQSAALSGNLFGDSSTRGYKVYLPPSYASSSKRYPVVYVLHGYGGDENELVGGMQST